MVLEMMLDTKETKGAIDEIRIFSPEGYGNELIEFSGSKNESWRYRLHERKNSTLEETVYNISINMRREIDPKCFNDWTNKRPTGFKAQWYLEDHFGKKMDIESFNILMRASISISVQQRNKKIMLLTS